MGQLDSACTAPTEELAEHVELLRADAVVILAVIRQRLGLAVPVCSGTSCI